MSSSGSPQAKLVREWLEAFERMDIELLTKPLHENFRYATYPRSLNMPEQTRDEWRSQIAATISFWTHMDVSFSNCPSTLANSLPTANCPFHYRSTREGHTSRLYSERSDTTSTYLTWCLHLIVLRNGENLDWSQRAPRSDSDR